MRIIQLIDSLDAGGAERMAINYANSLGNRVSFSGLICSRKEGILKSEIDSNVNYLFLNRKKIIDINALKLFSNYISSNKIEIIHAHGSSFFIACLMKLRFTSIKIFYHEHNGERLNQKKKNNFFLIISSLIFERVLTVNPEIEDWLKKNLFCKKINYIPNFAVLNQKLHSTTFLNGINPKKIVCLANLRNPKNHLFLLKVFTEIASKDWTLHLIGKDYNDRYSKQLKDFILLNNLNKKIFLYDSKQDIHHILSQAQIGILCSTYEGFPVSILEYGLAKLAVISSNVGFCKEIIIDKKTGLLFSPNDEREFRQKLSELMSSENLRSKIAQNLNKLVNKKYSEDIVITNLLKYYKI